MRHIDQTGNIPCRALGGRRQVNPGSQVRILIHRYAGPDFRCRRGDSMVPLLFTLLIGPWV
jgi:hypothetical protein